MSYDAKAYRVTIASPSDVTTERNLVRTVLSDWNAIHSMRRSIVLLPVGWETHSAPDLSARPQEIINKQVLKDCDLLVGVFWTRIGTSTGEYASGTVEEIEEHLAEGKPAMLYFSNTPVELDSVDAKQYQQLKDFKKKYYGRGLVESFSSPTEFKEKFSKQLQIKLNEDTYFETRNSELTFEGLSELIDSGPDIPELSEEAKQLLLEAAKSDNGTVMKVKFIGGIQINANGKEFVTDSNPRTRAVWEGAVDELETEGLISDRGNKGEIFGVTKEGYNLADILSPEE